ncbi:MAG: sulfide/dihydroorotate dehydrogenase-like FAD/NAD-binding protein [bacterium]
MYTIVHKDIIAPKIIKFEIQAPLIAAKTKPGHFVILRAFERSERIPITIADHNTDTGTITLIIQIVGQATMEMATMQEGNAFLDVVGPLGVGAEIKLIGTMVFIGGGVGTPGIYPEVKAAKQAGNKVICIIGAQSKEYLMLGKELEAISDKVYYSTNDGSVGIKGLVTDVLKQLIDSKIEINEVTAIGPLPMMKAVSDLTRPYGIKTMVSLNPIMIDGTGMCGGCRVMIKGKNMFSCVDGPEFDGHEVDFDELIRRTRQYSPMEQQEADRYRKFAEGTCKLAAAVK